MAGQAQVTSSGVVAHARIQANPCLRLQIGLASRPDVALMDQVIDDPI
jgi:hypothetical protein